MSYNPGISGISGASDVFLNNPASNDALSYNTAAGKWENTPVDKTRVGLANVDNTSDVNKPVSTAQQTAIDNAVSSIHQGPAGGTTGQILAKASNSDYAYTWVPGSSDVITYIYSAGTYPTIPVSKPAGVVLVRFFGPSQPSNLPSWIGLNVPSQVPATYDYMATA